MGVRSCDLDLMTMRVGLSLFLCLSGEGEESGSEEVK